MSSPPRRILITGSRTWQDEEIIRDALDAHAHAGDLIVTGGCRHGADLMAENYWRSGGGPIERHPADWRTYGRAAGPMRNKLMVDLGADLCLAFIRDASIGASMTARLAEKAGIRVYRYIT